MIENYDVLISGKAWDVLNLDEVFTSKILPPKLEKEISLEKKQTPDDDICVICFDRKIQLILNNCFVK